MKCLINPMYILYISPHIYGLTFHLYNGIIILHRPLRNMRVDLRACSVRIAVVYDQITHFMQSPSNHTLRIGSSDTYEDKFDTWDKVWCGEKSVYTRKSRHVIGSPFFFSFLF